MFSRFQRYAYLNFDKNGDRTLLDSLREILENNPQKCKKNAEWPTFGKQNLEMLGTFSL